MTILDLAITLTYKNDYKIDVAKELEYVLAFTKSYSGTAVYTHEYTKAKRLHIHGYVKCSTIQERNTHNQFIKEWRTNRGKVNSQQLYTPPDIFRWQVYIHKDQIKTAAYEDWIERYSHSQSDLERDTDEEEIKANSSFKD